MRRTRRATAQAWLGLLLFVGWGLGGGVGCGDIDAGSTPFPGTVLYTDPAGAFQFQLLEPPWIPASFDGVAVFVVPPSNLSDVTDLSSALYTLHVDTAIGTPETSRNQDETAAFATATTPADTLQIVEASLKTVSGLSAYEVSWAPSAGLFERDVFLAAPSSATFRLQFGAKAPIAEDAMITQMILSFEPL